MAAPVSNLLHRTPWWALLGGGLFIFLALVAFTTPFHLMRLEKSGATPEENRAIKSEIKSAFSEGAIDFARGIVQRMRDSTSDPAHREELNRALEEIDQAREELRQAGTEVMRAKRQAAVDASDAVKDATRAIAAAKKQAARALKDAGAEKEQVAKSLDESLEAAKRTGEEAKRAATEKGDGEKKPRMLVMTPGHDTPLLDLEIDKHSFRPPSTPLPPEVRQDIRRKLSGDLYRVGVGASLIVLFIPLFILAVVSKFFIDRSRAAQGVAEVKRKEADYHRMAQQVTEAKLSALQAQVEPHFLYNTLASVQALTEVDPQKASEMTAHLIQYLRNALPKMRGTTSTIAQEVELVRAYLNILQMRMGKRLSFEIAVPPELMDAPFPPLMLPSLVENAIKHGLEPQREGGSVRITAEAEGDKLRMSVADTGRGFAEAEALGTGVGLANIRERLAGLYGDAGKLTLEENALQGVKATIEVPRNPGPVPAGARAAGFQMPPPAAPQAAQPQPAAAKSMTARTLSAMGTAERAWRKGLSFAFVVLVVIAAVLAGLALVGIATGLMPMHFGDENIGGASGALIGTAIIAVGFAVVVLALAIVLAIVYGLGFLFVGLAIFIPLAVLVSIFPVIAPFILLGLGIWWLIRRQKKKEEARAPAQQ